MKRILIPRKTGEERKRNYQFSIQKKIKKYIKDGGRGDLILIDSPVEKLPDSLEVGGSLYLSDTPIKELPDNLKVGGILDLENTPIKELSGNLKVGRSLFLSNTQIEKLPDNLQVGHGLFLDNTPLSKKYSKPKIRNLIEEKGGYVKNNIFI
jgi:hypothetical protein